MNFDFSREQILLKKSVREYIRDRVAPLAEIRDREGPLSHIEAHDCLVKLAPFGFLGPLVPAADQGPGLSHVETGIIFQELARSWAAMGAIALSTSHFISLLMDSENSSIRSRILPGLLSGQLIGAVAVTESGAGNDFGGIVAAANSENDNFILNGEKTWVSNGAVADVLLVAVQVNPPRNDQKSVKYILVEKSRSAYLVGEIPKMGLKGLSTANLVFDRCRVPQSNLIGEFPTELPPGTYLGNASCCLLAAMAVGIMEAALEKSVSYARQREQFGKPLGQFQMIQQMIAGMATNLDAATLLCFRALKKLDENAVALKEIAMAKSFATQAAVDVASKAIQIHGAYGYSDEFPMERYYRDACCLLLMGGQPDMENLKIAQVVTGLSALN